IARGAVIGPDTRLVDTVVHERAVVQQTVARESVIGEGCTVGPYVSLRAGTFVETKNADIGEGAKVPHLSYMGDVEIGPRANVGAGTITANYDGRNKHASKIGADARLGSNTVLVAPVEVGDGAYTGAGSVVNRPVPPGSLVRGVPARVDDEWATRHAPDDAEDTDEPG